jgi:signal transduction histidine kinase
LEEQDRLARSVIEAEEKDRVRLVHELNEGIVQQISAASLNISALQSFLKTANATDKLMLQNAVDMLDDSVKEVRNVTQKMLPNVLIKAGLIEALKSHISKLNREKTKINFYNHGSFDRTTPVKESVLFRVVVELINNALKHADADTVNVQVIRHEKELSILIEDNGNGFDVEQFMKSDESCGLRSIQTRVNFLKGFIFFDSLAALIQKH